MIKVTLTRFTSPASMIIGTEVIENVTVVDVDDCYLRIITSAGEMKKYGLDIVKGYTVEVQK